MEHVRGGEQKSARNQERGNGGKGGHNQINGRLKQRPAIPYFIFCYFIHFRSQNNFERNQKDEFRFKASDIGDVEKLVIRHDNWGASPDWHLQQVCGRG